eukprot:CAMPEP_0197332134 /NCGR_PEP_ID=MMETSP0892-20130614/13865_1 /TAXON_ID=44058 ORGANISM="Aureoumbra lagunensis, Strain CCMP1510" /NCGR_SAMPLE_ID=MMETSP0892 /ASSEMBLY_ACC=CAM_ASM_000538 /LENGTH=230 /DNA_ID=CAMNT_0042830469 /DNA_START=42 /DNA_END=731 /DNA_ORIENTATION=-
MVKIKLEEEEIAFSYFKRCCSISDAREARRVYRNLPSVTKELFLRMAYQEVGRRLPPLKPRSEEDILTSAIRRQTQVIANDTVTKQLTALIEKKEKDIQLPDISTLSSPKPIEVKRAQDWPVFLRQHEVIDPVSHLHQWATPMSFLQLDSPARKKISLEDRWKPMKMTQSWQPKALRTKKVATKTTPIKERLSLSLFEKLGNVDDLNNKDKVLEVVNDWHTEVLNSPVRV